jgi:hypothetical protein
MDYFDMVDMIGLIELEEELNREKYMTNTENSSLVCFLHFFLWYLSFEHVNHLKGRLEVWLVGLLSLTNVENTNFSQRFIDWRKFSSAIPRGLYDQGAQD